jgi:hypothetical protein
MRRKKVTLRRLRLESLESRWVFAFGHDCFLGQFDSDELSEQLVADGESAETSQSEESGLPFSNRRGSHHTNDAVMRDHFDGLQDNELSKPEGESQPEALSRTAKTFRPFNDAPTNRLSTANNSINAATNNTTAQNAAIESSPNTLQVKSGPQSESGLVGQPVPRPGVVQLTFKPAPTDANSGVQLTTSSGTSANRLPSPSNPVVQQLAIQAATLQASTPPLRVELGSLASSHSTEFKFYRTESVQRETMDLGSTAMATAQNRDSALEDLESLLSDIAKEHWRNRNSEPRRADSVDTPAAPTISFSDVDPTITDGGMIALSIDRTNVITTILPDSNIDVDERKAWASNIGVYRAFEAGAVASVETKLEQRQEEKSDDLEDSSSRRMNPILASGSAFIGLIYFSLRRFRKSGSLKSDRDPA